MFTTLLVATTALVASTTSSLAARTGSTCNSKLGPGLCTPISQCRQLPRLRLGGKSPEVCGFDDNGPKVCCPGNTRPSFGGYPDAYPFGGAVQKDDPYNTNTRRDNLFDSDNGNSGFAGFSRPSSDAWRGEDDSNSRPGRPSWSSSSENDRRTQGDRPGRPSENGGRLDERNPDFPDLSPSSWDDRRPPSRPSGSGRPGKPGSRPESTTEERFLWDEPKVNTTRPKYAWKPTIKRISEIMCDEYTAFLSPPNSRSLRQGAPASKRPVSQCYQAPLQLIVGGRDADYGEFPHMAALGYLNDNGKIAFECGGTLISDEFVLTAAHCILTVKGAPVKVRMGVVDLMSNDANRADYIIADTIVHPDYRKNKQYNDIALVRLEGIVQLSKGVRPACLANEDAIPVKKAVATGWGRLTTVGHQSVDSLQKVEVTVIDNKKCDQLFQDAVYPQLSKGITKDMVCAGEDGKDTCLGDSGGPLQFTKKDNKCIYYVCGITSFGKSTCGARNSAGVYTRVSSFLQWIEGVVWPQ